MDSKVAIQAIASNKQATSHIANEARKTIKVLNRQGKTVVYHWVPSHVGIHGNEIADLLAKKKGPHFTTNKIHLTTKQLRDL